MSKLTQTSVFKSASGLKLPVLGLGTWQSTGAEIEAAVDAALEAGYRLIDTAYIYRNEDVIGKVLHKWLSSGKIKREDLFVTTKLPFTAINAALVKDHLDKSLKALQLDYVDLYLIHHSVGFLPMEAVRNADGALDFTKLKLDMKTDHVAVWKEMEKQVDAGRAKAIGVSNFNIQQIERVIKNSRIPPANLQIEMHVYCQSKNVQEFCKKNGMTLTSYSTLGSPGAPSAYKTAGARNPLQDPVVIKIAEAHKKVPAQILLRHMMQSGVAVIPKSANPQRLKQNLQVFDFELSASEMKQLNDLDKGEAGRLFDFAFMNGHPEHPFHT